MLAEILRHTPAWVFVLFVLLLVLGFLQTRTRAVPLPRLALLPLAMLGLSVYGIVSGFGAHPLPLACWAAALAAVVAANFALRFSRRVFRSPTGGSFTVPGSWVPLALMMAIFFTRYAVAVALARDAALAAVPGFAAAAGLAYGAFSGVFVARALHILRAERA